MLAALNELSSDEGISLLLVAVFSIFLFLVLVSVGFLEATNITLLFIYFVIFAVLTAALVFIWVKVESSTLKTVSIIALFLLIAITVIIGITRLFSKDKTNAFYKFGKNPLFLNPTIQLDKIRAWGFTTGIGGIIVLILAATVVMLFISGVHYIDVYENFSPASQDQTFGKSFALVWGIFNFVIGSWITIQTLYFIKVIFDMIIQDRKDKCQEIIYKDGFDNNKGSDTYGLPIGEFREFLKKNELAYVKENNLKGIVDYGIIDSNGVYIPKEFLDADTRKPKLDTPADRLTYDAYMERYKKRYKKGEIVMYENGFIQTLLEDVKKNLKASKTPYEIKAYLLSRLKEASKGVDSRVFSVEELDKLKAAIKDTKKTTANYSRKLELPESLSVKKKV